MPWPIQLSRRAILKFDIGGPDIVPERDKVGHGLLIEDTETKNDILNDADDTPGDEKYSSTRCIRE